MHLRFHLLLGSLDDRPARLLCIIWYGRNMFYGLLGADDNLTTPVVTHGLCNLILAFHYHDCTTALQTRTSTKQYRNSCLGGQHGTLPVINHYLLVTLTAMA